VVLVNAPIRTAAALTDTGLRTTENLLGTYAQLLVSRPVLEQVALNLGVKGGSGALGKEVLIAVEPSTLLIKVTVQDRSPEMAANIANEVPKVLNSLERDLLANPFVGAYREALNFVDVAQPHASPVLPRGAQTLLIAILAALALSVGAALLIEHLDDTIKASREVEQLTSLPTLATIGRIRGSDYAARLITAQDPQSPVSEAYRMFLAHLAFSASEAEVKTVLVASADREEGKSTNIANLAVALAQTGKRVILVDMDLRGPVLHRFFKRTNQRGVTTALQRAAGEAQPRAAQVGQRQHEPAPSRAPESLTDGNHLVSTGVENLMLMPSGPLPANPARLFGSGRIGELIEELEREADIVLIDSPSVLAVVDATLLARHCDAAILVARTKTTRGDRLVRAKEMIAQSGVYLIGVLLNDASYSRQKRYTADQGGLRGLLSRVRAKRVAYAASGSAEVRDE
jgi:non-specific protein-tyrosine kinase